MSREGDLGPADPASAERSENRTTLTCRICGGRDVQSLEARELFYGTQEPFEYFECVACGCVQIVTVPDDLGRYYPNNYYAFDAAQIGVSARLKALAIWLVLFVAPVLQGVPGLPDRSTGMKFWLRHAQLCRNRSARILDVGAGGGTFVRLLRYLGYENATGLDAFVDADRFDRGRLLVHRGDLSTAENGWDLICFNDVLEHLPDQLDTLLLARDRLAPDGKILIRVPIVGGEAWRSYATEWAQFDAPRHLYLHSRRSLETLIRTAGLEVISLEYDSTAFQFEGSELFRAGLSLIEPRPKEIVERFRRAGYAKRARSLNFHQDGDHVAVVAGFARAGERSPGKTQS